MTATLLAHTEGPDCVCKPTLKPIKGATLVIHQPLDIDPPDTTTFTVLH